MHGAVVSFEIGFAAGGVGAVGYEAAVFNSGRKRLGGGGEEAKGGCGDLRDLEGDLRTRSCGGLVGV